MKYTVIEITMGSYNEWIENVRCIGIFTSKKEAEDFMISLPPLAWTEKWVVEIEGNPS